MRCALPFAVIIDNQITCQPHQPLLQVTLLGVILIQRTINPDKNFLSQVFSCVSPGRESVSEIIDSSGVAFDNLLPRRTITSAASANQFGSFAGSQNFCSPHLSLLRLYLVLKPLAKVENPCEEAITTARKLKFRPNILRGLEFLPLPRAVVQPRSVKGGDDSCSDRVRCSSLCRPPNILWFGSFEVKFELMPGTNSAGLV